MVVNCSAQTGGAFSLVGSVLRAVDASFLSNTATLNGGVVDLVDGSTFVATETRFRRNVAGRHSGVVHISGDGTFEATKCSFVENRARIEGGVSFVATTGLLTVYNCSFDGNGADIGGVASIWGSGIFITNASTFIANRADFQGGVVRTSGISSFCVTDTLFHNNEAFAGDIVYLTESSTLELLRATLSRDWVHRPNTTAVRCEGTGTTYASQLTMDLTPNLFMLDKSCVLFLYQTNFNGSMAYGDAVMKAVDLESASVNFIYWSYPCGAGTWSADGIEHGDTPAYLDGNGYTIDFNDPYVPSLIVVDFFFSGRFCSSGPALPDCAAPCRTCKSFEKKRISSPEG